MPVPLASLTPDHLKAADVIEAVDPKQSGYRKRVWGQGVVPPVRPWPAGPRTIRAVEVQIDSSQSPQLQDLLRQVEAAKGCLHPDVETLKK